MKYIAILFIVFLVYLLMQSAFERQYNAGVREGRGMALKTNPPSEELEIVCAGLWVGEQNKKFMERTK